MKYEHVFLFFSVKHNGYLLLRSVSEWWSILVLFDVFIDSNWNESVGVIYSTTFWIPLKILLIMWGRKVVSTKYSFYFSVWTKLCDFRCLHEINLGRSKSNVDLIVTKNEVRSHNTKTWTNLHNHCVKTNRGLCNNKIIKEYNKLPSKASSKQNWENIKTKQRQKICTNI